MEDKVRKIIVLVAERGTTNQVRKSLVASPEFLSLSNHEDLKRILMQSAEKAIEGFLKGMKV